MVMWNVRWNAPHDRTTTAQVLRLPPRLRPAAVLPLQSTVAEAHAKIRHLASIFPEIIMTTDGTIDGRSYTIDILRFVRQGFAMEYDGKITHTRFGVTADESWTPEQACQLLGPIRLTVGDRGYVERPFPDHIVQQLIAGPSSGRNEWRSTSQAYMRNGLRVYTRLADHPDNNLCSTFERIRTMANGLLLDSARELPPLVGCDIDCRYTGVVEERHGYKGATSHER